MTLRVVEQAGITDVGRQRQANEDALVLAAPLFAVADGMGGARAGEVASAIAAEEFDGLASADTPPERRLASAAKAANRRIYELAQRDDAHRGMGTTLTAALLDGDAVSVGHVGDSRLYRLRGGELRQLTRDHSLVAELERSGQLTPEAAEHHPQRSIITRALGPEPDVDVDTHTHAARGGDVYLLCSDGLTGMIGDEELAKLLRSAPSLDAAAAALVRAANQGGGKDNITVVLFRVEDDGGAPAAPGEAAAETIHGGVTADELRAEAERREVAAAAAARPAEPAPPARPVPPAARRERRPRWRVALAAAVTLLAVVAVGALAYAGSRQVYFVGTDDTGLVTLYRGLPYELPFGVDLYTAEYRSGVPVGAIPATRRERVLDHEWRGRADAEDLVRQLELGTLDPGRRPG